MSEFSGEVPHRNQPGKRICRVAYTFQNKQPVTSTIISDQPLFYMDYDVDYEDDYIYELYEREELDDLDEDLEDIGQGRFSAISDYCAETRFEEFLDNAGMLCQPIEKARNHDDIDALLDTISGSRMAQAYIECARKYDVRFSFCPTVGKSEYDRLNGIIRINPYLNTEDKILLLACELRRHWQHRQGVLIHPLMFSPDNAVLINRVHQADICVSMIRIAWELQLAECKAPWDRLQNSVYCDLIQPFVREAYTDFRSLNSGEASRAVFEAWFLSQRCVKADRDLIYNMLADHNGYVSGMNLNDMTTVPNVIAGLGNMPHGNNYLSAYVHTITSDPVFIEVRDRSNANFLWFIKFEQTFRETEHELQSELTSQNDGVRPSAIKHKAQDVIHDQNVQRGDLPSTTGDIVHLSPERVSGPHGQAQQSQSAEIIYLRRWSGE